MRAESGWIHGRDWPYTLGMALVTLFALLAPPDVLDRSSLLNAFSNAVASALPFVDLYAQISLWPQLTRATLALAMALIPVVLPFTLWFQIRALDVKRIKSSRFTMRWGWLLLPGVVFPFLLEPSLKSGRFSGLVDHLAVSSRLGLGVFASVLMLVEVFLIVWVVVWLRVIFGGNRDE